ncbi:glutamate 5-kinase [Synechococcus sp. MU1611]|uniref:glutamate 5-kinase n=1 Tax=Synechococcus sp. MU1611 TaxID=2508345 RepID=UPI001CF925F4|nr:glutamate 5-kinase [Synechococcus sp. MU1611]MCB4410445.1 glutamate 5-kinase [Synechococcus sp. MU1611]
MTLWVVKIGTSLLRGETAATIEGYARCFAAAMARGDQVVLVTSGAVGLGCQKLAMSSRPDTVVALQAAAAIGQGALMALYERAMARHGCSVAQVLLTRSDLADRRRYQNASGTLRQLLSWGVMPVINENDALSTAELRFGDNDTLSALVAAAVEAQQLILLTDVDRLYSSDPRVDADAEPISDVRHPRDLDQLEQGAGDGGRWGTGGMTTKLAAARIATASGITVQLADGRNPSRLEALLQGERGGTVFHPHPEPLGNRRSWLAHVLRPEGELQLDAGACDALKHRGASLLLVGVTAVRGDFAANQPVQLLDPQGQDVGRGLCSMDSDQLRAVMNAPSLGESSPVVVHRDALVLRSR